MPTLIAASPFHFPSLGFEVKEPLALMRGKPTGDVSSLREGRPMQESDLPACADLCPVKPMGF
jgi:hypothetical protein